MNENRRKEKAQAEYKPKEEKAHGYEPRQQSRTYREFVNFRKANEQAENKWKEQAESKKKDEKARVSKSLGISCPFPSISRCWKHDLAVSPPEHAPLLIALTERRNADFETYLGVREETARAIP